MIKENALYGIYLFDPKWKFASKGELTLCVNLKSYNWAFMVSFLCKYARRAVLLKMCLYCTRKYCKASRHTRGMCCCCGHNSQMVRSIRLPPPRSHLWKKCAKHEFELFSRLLFWTCVCCALNPSTRILFELRAQREEKSGSNRISARHTRR